MIIIDVSKNNGREIDWDKVKTDPKQVVGVYIKATEGQDYTDPFLRSNATGAQRVGIPIGYYHFASLNTLDVVNDATKEANDFLNAIKDLPKNDLPLGLDVEREQIDLNPDQFTLWVKTFIDIIQAAKKEPCLYSGYYFLNANLKPNHPFGSLKLWHAQYTDATSPTIAKGWNKCWLWQYSCKGTIAGIKGVVDLSKLM